MAVFGEGVINRALQFASLILAPVILIMGMFLITVLHQVLIEVLTSLVSSSLADALLGWFVHFLALVAFVGLLAFIYFFVKNKGFGLFE